MTVTDLYNRLSEKTLKIESNGAYHSKHQENMLHIKPRATNIRAVQVMSD